MSVRLGECIETGLEQSLFFQDHIYKVFNM